MESGQHTPTAFKYIPYQKNDPDIKSANMPYICNPKAGQPCKVYPEFNPAKSPTPVISILLQRLVDILGNLFWLTWPYFMAMAALITVVLLVHHAVVTIKSFTYHILESTAEVSIFYGVVTALRASLPYITPMASSFMEAAWIAYGGNPEAFTTLQLQDSPVAWWQDPYVSAFALLSATSTAFYKAFGPT